MTRLPPVAAEEGLTVAALIERLQKLPPRAPVVLAAGDGGSWAELTGVGVVWRFSGGGATAILFTEDPAHGVGRPTGGEAA